MIQDLIDGAIVWCISASDESQRHGDDSVRKPWRGVLKRSDRGVWHVLSFIDGEVDYDSNACACLGSNKHGYASRAVFTTHDEARTAYIEAERAEIDLIEEGLTARKAALTAYESEPEERT